MDPSPDKPGRQLPLALLHDVLEALPDALVVADARGAIVLVNRRAEAFLGYARGELLGAPHELLLAERFRELHRAHWQAYLRAPRARPMGAELELFARRKDGREIPVEISLSPLESGGELLVLSSLRDVSEARRQNAELRRRLRQQRVLEELGLLALHTRDLPALLSEAARLACEALEADYCKVLELQPDGETLLLRAGHGWREGVVGRATIGLASLAGHALRSDQPIVAERLGPGTLYPVPPLLQEHGVRSSMAVIIYRDGAPYGVLGVDSKAEKHFSPGDLTTLKAVANLLGQAILRYSAERALHLLNGELERRVEERTRALSESEERFQKAFHASPTPTVILDPASARLLDVNESFVKLLGYRREELLERSIFALGILAAPEAHRPLLARLRAQQSVAPTELELRTKAASLRTVLCSAEPVQLGGQPCALATYVDISVRKRTEEELMQAIQATVQDAAWFSQTIMEKLVQIRKAKPAPGELEELTEREREVLVLVAKGWDDARIAEELGLARQTIYNYLSRLYDKLNVRSRAEVIVWARQRGYAGLE